METVTLDMLYLELKKIRKKVDIVEHAVIPTEKLSAAELASHKADLKEALSGERVSLKDL
jgi:hypothetical protein